MDLQDKQITVDLNRVKRMEIIRKWPVSIPRDYLIFNAPRPICSSLPVTLFSWNAKGPHGRFFAAVDPEDPEADIWIKSNLQNSAFLVTFIPLAEHRARVIKWATEVAVPEMSGRYSTEITLGSWDLNGWDRAYRYRADQEGRPEIFGIFLKVGEDVDVQA